MTQPCAEETALNQLHACMAGGDRGEQKARDHHEPMGSSIAPLKA